MSGRGRHTWLLRDDDFASPGPSSWEPDDGSFAVDDWGQFEAVVGSPLSTPARRRLVKLLGQELARGRKPEMAVRILRRTDLDLADLMAVATTATMTSSVFWALVTHPAAEQTLLVRLALRGKDNDDVHLREDLDEHSALGRALNLLIYEAGILDDSVERAAMELAAAGDQVIETAARLAEEMDYPYFVLAAIGVIT